MKLAALSGVLAASIVSAKWGRIWFMATPKYPSSAPPSTAVNSEIHTDYIEVRVNYTLP
jgi:hypothetical protein